MKKFVILPLIAAASLGLAACGGSKPAVDNTANASDAVLNSEDALDVNATDEALNVTDNATVVDNATALDSAENVTAN